MGRCWVGPPWPPAPGRDARVRAPEHPFLNLKPKGANAQRLCESYTRALTQAQGPFSFLPAPQKHKGEEWNGKASNAAAK